MNLKDNFTYLVLCSTDIVYRCICYIFAILMNIFRIYVSLLPRGFSIFFWAVHVAERRGEDTKGRNDAGSRQLKWDEVQDTVCSSRRNFAHVPLSRSLQPGKGRMAGKSRTVEVRFYKESRVLGCEGIGGEGADAS